MPDALLTLVRLRPQFEAIEPVHFPPGLAGNTIRGALGTSLAPEIFAPVSSGSPSGLADPPRCFVLRASHLDGCEIQPGSLFAFDMHLFDLARQADFTCAFEALGRSGIGAGRSKVRLADVEREQIEVPASAPDPTRRLGIEFLTPTELKAGGKVVQRPEFPIFFARVRDRVATLRAIYGPEPLTVDFQGLGERSQSVRTTRCEIRQVDVARRSSRTGQTHAIGGFIGCTEYEGDLAEFVPYIRAGEWTGVGRQTTWGKGAYRVLAI